MALLDVDEFVVLPLYAWLSVPASFSLALSALLSVSVSLPPSPSLSVWSRLSLISPHVHPALPAYPSCLSSTHTCLPASALEFLCACLSTCLCLSVYRLFSCQCYHGSALSPVMQPPPIFLIFHLVFRVPSFLPLPLSGFVFL